MPETSLENPFNPSPKGISSFAKSPIEDPPVNHDAIPFIISAAVSKRITSVNDFTPSNIEESIFLAPSTNVLIFSIKEDRLSAIPGRALVVPSAIPPARPPINFPNADPIAISNPPLPLTSSFKPGISANLPIPANTNANSVITTPAAITPIIAAGAKAANSERASISADIKPTPSIPFTNISGSIVLSASITPWNNDISMLTRCFIKSGILSAKASITAIKKSNIKLTIFGAYSTSDAKTLTTILSIPSTILGTHFISTSTNIITNAVIALAIAGQHSIRISHTVRIIAFIAAPNEEIVSAIAWKNEEIPSPNLYIRVGNKSARPTNTTVIAAIIAFALPARPVNPIEIARIPAPIRTHAAPKRAIAIDIFIIVVETGAKSLAAAPNIMNADAIANKPFAKSAQLIPSKTFNTGIKRFNAITQTKIDAAPDIPPLANFIAEIIPIRATPIPRRPFAIFSQDILPRSSIAEANIFIAVPIRIIPKADDITFLPLGSNLIANTTPIKAIPKDIKPLTSVPRPIDPSVAMADANIFIAAPINISPKPEDITFLPEGSNLIASITPIKATPNPRRPFTKFSQDIDPNSTMTEANIFMAEPSSIIPNAEDITFLPEGSNRIAPIVPIKATPNPTRPFAN